MNHWKYRIMTYAVMVAMARGKRERESKERVNIVPPAILPFFEIQLPVPGLTCRLSLATPDDSRGRVSRDADARLSRGQIQPKSCH